MRRLCVIPLILLCGCSDPPRPKAEESTDPVSAQTAFHRMFVSARGWAQDALPLRVAQIDVEEVRAEAGKAAAWEAVFLSQAQQKMRRFTYSVINRPARNLRGGVNAEPPQAWSGGGERPFVPQGFRTDSTAAYKVAMKHGRDYARKHPDQPVKFLLEWTTRFPAPTWRVYWGETVSSSPYSVFVDAVTGEYAGTAR
jgi:hypothetical protein